MSTRDELSQVLKEYDWVFGIMHQEDLFAADRSVVAAKLADICLTIEVLSDFVAWDL